MFLSSYLLQGELLNEINNTIERYKVEQKKK
jgi:hypothetical protein